MVLKTVPVILEEDKFSFRSNFSRNFPKIGRKLIGQWDETPFMVFLSLGFIIILENFH